MSRLTLAIALLTAAMSCTPSAEALDIQSKILHQGVHDIKSTIPWKYPPPVLSLQNQQLHIVLEGNSHIVSVVFYMAVNYMTKSSQSRYTIFLYCRVIDYNDKVCEGTGGPKLKPGEVVHYSIKAVLIGARVMWLSNQRWTVEEHPLTTGQRS
ncbi:uncharacterized protein [Palaemon carinicauda]|uniref:uncharacterized protein n=1 Tax=Palaemon carinicauda TaxID=392227 RepID=UPI0035B63EF3